MNGFYSQTLLFVFALLLPTDCSAPKSFKVIHQTLAPPLETNCYLLYNEMSNEAALIDVGGPVDSLLSTIEKKNLKLKFIFITHCHPDHVYGVPAVKKLFPDAKLCISREDYEDAKLYAQWEKKLSPEEVAEIKKFPELIKLMSFDISSICSPDIFLEDNQTYKVGNIEVRTIFSPGHSRGSVCYYAGNVLFSGDVLFYRSVGRTDLEGMSWESLVRSVRRLYSLLPDETVVYPGHGQFTTIGSEKKYNARIAEDKTVK
jgi:hydroxyacylglutathione hydrolase